MSSLKRIRTLIFIGSFFLLSGYVPFGLSQVTAPEDYLGYKPGADFHLATYEQLTGYFELIAHQTKRLRVFDMGPTTEGRRMNYVIISSEENMAELERYRKITRQLSIARGISDEEAQRLADEGKVIVWIDSGIHSTETSPQMHQFQLAYDLVTGEDRRTRFIRENVILLLVHANPDGMTLVADWYTKNLGTTFENSGLPVLYNKYAGHDNNRDAFMANLQETQNMNRIIGKEWFPELFYSQHETAPFPARIWIPPNPEPVNPNMHPIIIRWKNLVGSAMGQGFESAGQPGAISRNAYDLWYPGYADGPSVEGHNIPSVLTETANYRYATPFFYTLNDFPEEYRDLIMGTFYPSPWEGGWWRLKDAVDYNLTASKSVLDVAAKYRYEFLYYKYKMATDIIAQFEKEPPYGWIISAHQRDPNTTALMLNRFIDYGIEVYRADTAFIYNGIPYPEGSYIIPTSQPFGMYVKNILEKQSYPDLRKYGHLWQGISSTVKWSGAPLAPYDGVGWTLPIQMGVDAGEMSTPVDVGKEMITEAVSPRGILSGNGQYYVFMHTDNNSFIALNRILETGGQVSVALLDFTLGGEQYPKGTFIVKANSIKKDILKNIAEEARIPMKGGEIKVTSKPLSKSRIALYKSWVATADAGWISYILDKYSFTYYILTDAEMRAGNLRRRFDVVILPEQGASSIINGHRRGTMPPEYVGGIGVEGVDNLRTFVEEGGVLVCHKSSSDLPIRNFNLPIKNVLQSVPSDSFNCPGSLLKVNFDTSHPLAFGMQEKGIAYFSGGYVFDVPQNTPMTEEKRGNQLPKIVANYPDETLLISGWMIGENRIKKKAAVIEIPFGEGTIILFGFSIHNRAQAYSTFKLLFNALYY